MPDRKTLYDAHSSGDPAYLARRIDSSAMKAFAHPLRMAMYDYLTDRGSATATMLARHTGESTGQTSYHLRQLERHGFVAEDPGRGTHRERWWKSVGFRMDEVDLAKDSGTRPAVGAMLLNQVNQHAEALKGWFQRSEGESIEWREASINNRATAVMTAREAADLSRALMEIIHEHTEQAKARHEDPDAAATGQGGVPDEETRRVRLYLNVFPLAGEE